jgi:hypothetical protein
VTGRAVALPRSTRGILNALFASGTVITAAGIVVAPERVWANWLLVGYYALGIGLAGLCFVAIHYTTGSSWSVAIRRVPEALAGTLPLGVALLVILFAAHPQLYEWTRADFGAEADSAWAFKRVWLSRPFFLMRAAVYAAVWLLFAAAIRRASLQQDKDGDAQWTRGNTRRSAAFLAAFAVTFSLASFDWIMSLEPEWYSTIFAVYNFASLFLSGLAAIILAAIWLDRLGPLQGVLTEEHLHDLGKLLFAFSTFWMYIWFSQYMLVWYTNIPEESAYFVKRTQDGWLVLFYANVVLNWLLPFAMLLRRDAKRHRLILALAAATVLAGRWLDLYLMIFPAASGDAPVVGLWELGLTSAGVGAFGLLFARIVGGAPAVPLSDPRFPVPNP